MAQPRTSLITHVSNAGQEQIQIIVHSGINLPASGFNDSVKSYVTCQSRYTLNTQNVGEKPNATATVEGRFPIWNDLVFVDTLDRNVSTEELILLIIDDRNQKNIAEYRIPWNWLQPNYFYHLELAMPTATKNSDNDIKLYVSLVRKQTLLSKQEYKYYGLECLLNQFDSGISKKQSIYAVARVVPNYQYYRTNFLRTSDSVVEFLTVVFPSPLRNSFVPKSFDNEGYPQVALASKESLTPVWNHNFCFSSNSEKDSMFNGGDSALVIEFYPLKKNFGRTWRINELLGWCKIKLDDRCRKALENDGSGMGLRTEMMIVEGDGLSDDKGIITAEVVLRVISAKNPKRVLNPVNTSSLSVLNSYHTQEAIQNGIDPIYLTTRVVRKTSIVPAIEPKGDFQRNYLRPSDEFSRTLIGGDFNSKNFLIDDFSDIPADYRHAFLSYKQPSGNDAEGWAFYYQNLVPAYKSLVRKMNDDLNLYRQQLRNLELANIQLTTKMTNFEDKKSALVKLAEINEMDKTKLNQTFYEIKTRLAIKTNENLVLKDQIERLKKELLRKQDVETELNKLIKAQNAQNSELQTMQQRLSKAYGLEDTCKRQELVIEKLEGLIHKMIRERREKAIPDPEYNRVKDEIDGIMSKDFDL